MSLRPLRRVQGVSFPRSGHHALTNALKMYWERSFVFCHPPRHCQQIPCSDPANSLQQVHDLDAQLKQHAGWTFLLQWRAPYPALSSWYEWHEMQGEWGQRGERSLSDWRAWLQTPHPKLNVTPVGLWRRWVHKWLLPRPPRSALVVRYEDLVTEAQSTIARVIRWWTPDAAIDERRLLEAAATIRGARDPRAWRFWDEADEQAINAQCAEELEALT